jgi:virulence-associated protein VagC
MRTSYQPPVLICRQDDKLVLAPLRQAHQLKAAPRISPEARFMSEKVYCFIADATSNYL